MARRSTHRSRIRTEATEPTVPSRGPSRGELFILCGILGVGALLRFAYLGEIRGAPDFASPAIDAAFHDYWARGLVTSDWTTSAGRRDPQIPTTPYFRPPGYPYFLALIYLTSGGG